MGPYRVTAVHEKFGTAELLDASLRKHKLTGEMRIYIRHRLMAGSAHDHPLIAYRRATSTSYATVDSYSVKPTQFAIRGYDVHHEDPWYIAKDNCPTLQNALQSAMEDFCKVNNLEITRIY